MFVATVTHTRRSLDYLSSSAHSPQITTFSFSYLQASSYPLQKCRVILTLFLHRSSSWRRRRLRARDQQSSRPAQRETPPRARRGLGLRYGEACECTDGLVRTRRRHGDQAGPPQPCARPTRDLRATSRGARTTRGSFCCGGRGAHRRPPGSGRQRPARRPEKKVPRW